MLQHIRKRHGLTALFLAVAVLGLSACQTVEGFGRDVQSGGEAIEETSRDVQNGGGSGY